jgi:hypothetical protein
MSITLVYVNRILGDDQRRPRMFDGATGTTLKDFDAA